MTTFSFRGEFVLQVPETSKNTAKNVTKKLKRDTKTATLVLLVMWLYEETIWISNYLVSV